MRYSYLLALIFAASLATVTVAQDDAEEGDAPPPPPPPAEAAAAPPPPANFDLDPENNFGRNPEGRRKTREWKANEEIYIVGGRNCYIRPQCNSEKGKSRFKGKLSGRRLMCQPGKPKPEQKEFVWKAHPCTSPEGKKHHFVRFENGKHKNRYLCLTRKPHKCAKSKRRYGSHLAILGHKKNGGCGWKVKEALVYNRFGKTLEKRFVFINRKHKHYILRARRKCKNSPPGPRRLFAAQNYLNEARLDTLGTFKIEAAGAAPTGYDV
jgi:hypothetical protein